MNLAEITDIEPIGPVCAALATSADDDVATDHRRTTYGAFSLATNFIKTTEVSHSVFNKAEDAICKWLTENLRFPRMLTNFSMPADIDEFSRVGGGEKAVILNTI